MGGTHPVPQAARNACYACTTQPFEAVTFERNMNQRITTMTNSLSLFVKGGILILIGTLVVSMVW